MSLNIRKIQKSDNAELAAIIRETIEEFNAPKEGTVYSDSTTDHLFEYFQQAGAAAWTAELNNSIVGCCGIYPTLGLNHDTTELVKFYLKASSRGKGIGKQLLQTSIDYAKSLKYKALYIESLPEFKAAIHLYEKFNFKQLDHRLGESGHSSCNIWMIKNL